MKKFKYDRSQLKKKKKKKKKGIMMYTNGLVTRDQCGWGLTAKQGKGAVLEDSGIDRKDSVNTVFAYRVTASSLTVEVRAVTNAVG